MSKGYLILAQKTHKMDYTRLAYALALSIKNSQSSVNKVALATDAEDLPEKYYDVFDNIVPIPWTDHAANSKWKIENKWKYLYMTPFDETVILDADMLFPEDISHWWDIMSQKDIWIANAPKTFKGDTITSTKFRETFVANELPNVYTAFMYFKKSELASEVFRMTEIIFNNWERFYFEYLGETRPKHLSGDVAFALAIKILGVENECFGNLEIPTFVHMKAQLQNISESVISENWPENIPTYFSQTGRFKIGNYQQIYPFHYYVKDWLTDEMIDILEKRVLGNDS